MLSGKLVPKTPKGHKRPADVASNAVHVMKIATGEIEETLTDNGKDAAAVALGRKGGLARAKKLSAQRRAAIARQAARARHSR
jgi:2-keto-3-deoxy-6-phosphogluconate aldolase